ncbi:MAG: enoyl-CoA hydratase/isomerase family protein [Gammaproteobacteria bacterium]|nr:enoyl-CoA hydratase/isomerase family protein [Gammaproteobacteria bacterium]
MTQSLLANTDTRGVCTLTLNRPDKHNALDNTLIKALLHALALADKDNAIRIVIVTGKGKSFSSGADVNWMRSRINDDHTANCLDAQQLAQLLHTLYALSKPTIARVNGSAFGGALGLIACCDIAISVKPAQFAFTEALLGIVPAVISPYIITAIGARQAKRLFLSARKFSSNEALSFGLLHDRIEPAALDNTIEAEITTLLKASPLAQQECKRLIHKLAGVSDDISQYTTELIATIRNSDEGREGMSAFLDKRKPNWIK